MTTTLKNTQPKHIESISDSKKELARLKERLVSRQTLFERFEHEYRPIPSQPSLLPWYSDDSTVNAITNMLPKCDSNFRDQLSNTKPESLVEYQGGYDYTVKDARVQPLLDYYLFNLTRDNKNFCYYFKELSDYIKKGEQQYLKDYLEEKISSATTWIEEEEKEIREKLELLRFMQEQVDNWGPPTKGDFSFYYPKEREMIQDHYIAMKELELEDFFAKECESFMFNDSPEITRFGRHPLTDKKYGHSGMSMAYCCRIMQSICQKGWEQFADGYRQYYQECINVAKSEGLL